MFQRAALVATVFVAFLATLTSAQSIASFTLVNADTNEDIQTLTNGETLTKPNSNINVRANTSPDPVGSVVFEVNGSEFRTENVSPYALAGDKTADYFNPSVDHSFNPSFCHLIDRSIVRSFIRSIVRSA